MSSSKKLFQLAQVLSRSTSRNVSDVRVTPRFSKMKAKQELLGVPNNIPVHIKAGYGDSLLVKLTWVLTGAGLIGAGQTLYQLVLK